MKKILLTAMCALATLSLSAQYWTSGSDTYVDFLKTTADRIEVGDNSLLISPDFKKI